MPTSLSVRRRAFTFLSLVTFLPTFGWAGDDHASDDQFWADAAALLPGFTGQPAAPGPSSQNGQWGPVLTWPHVPVSAATLPNGKLMTYSGQERLNWPGTKTQTYTATWDPATGAFDEDLYLDHEMFCAHLVMRTDGVVQTVGGRYTIEHSSVFDFRTNRWSRADDLNDRRWYTTAVALPDGDVFNVSGNGGPNTAERYDHDSNQWNMLSGINWQPVASAAGFESNWWPYLFVAPDGRMFHFGPTEQMHWVSAEGTGSRVSAGIVVPDNHYPKHAGVVMYDSGKILVAGGAASTSGGSTNKCYTVDLNTNPPTVQMVAPMANARRFANVVVLPNGEVMMIGGNTSGQKFSDNGSILATEIWNPATNQWRTVAGITVPRNYHSLGMLLPDGRVFAGGGGYGGNGLAAWNHKDAQIYTPPHLFQSNGQPATRPAITTAPESVATGSVFEVSASPNMHRFAAVRMMAATHGWSTDQRRLDLPFAEDAAGQYRIVAHPNVNVMIPGYWMLFAIDANGVYSESAIMHVKEAGVGSANGLKGEYFDGTTLTTLKETRIDPQIDLNFGTSSPNPALLGDDTYSVRWTGWVVPEHTQTYTFFTNADDGTRLWVNGQQLINDWTIHGAVERSGSIALTAGVPVPIKLEWFENNGAASVQLRWSSASTPKAIIPERSLFHTNPTGTSLLAVDDVHELFVNGELVGIGTEDNKVYRNGFSAGSKTTIAIRACDVAGGQFAIGDFLLNGQRLVTNTSWKVSTTAPAGWNQPGFNDSAWANATDYGAVPAGLSGLPTGTAARRIWAANANADEVYFRITVGGPQIAAIANRVQLTGTAVNILPSVTGASGATSFTASNLPGGLSINANNGRITGSLTTQGVYNTIITVTDAAGDSDTEAISWVVRLPGQGSGSLLREWWTGINGNAVTDLLADPRYPDNPTGSQQITSFPAGVAFAENYGSRLRGYIHAPVSGNYRFWLSTDNGGSLRLSTSDNPAAATGIASIPGTGYAGVNDFTKYPEQVSVWIPLVGGQKYYLEVLHQEGTGGDHINLAWRRPGDAARIIVDGSYLSPFVPNRAPVLAAVGNRAQTIGGVVALNLSATDPDGDVPTYTATGLPSGLVLNATSGLISGAATAAGSFQVTVQANDGSGASDSETFTWTVNVQPSVAPIVTASGNSGGAINFTANGSGGTSLRYSWNFGDGTASTSPSASPAANHTYSSPGRYAITLTVTDLGGGQTVVLNFFQNVRPALLANAPAVSQSIIVAANGRVWNVNPDNDSVAVFAATTHAKLAEIAVGASPRALAEAPDGRIWVTNKRSDTVSIINPTSLAVVQTISLPYGSMPHGVAMSPTDGHAYIALETKNQIRKFNATTGAYVAARGVGTRPRHISIDPTGTKILVSRFITPRLSGEHTANPNIASAGGRVALVDAATFTLTKTILLANSTEPDSGGGGRGVPNYLGGPAISPAGDMAWVPSKQDNIFRGMLRDGAQLDHDNTVRAIVSRINLGTDLEDYNARVDHDDAAVPSAAIFGPGGLYVFVALEGSRDIAVIDAYGQQELFRFNAGRAPQGLAVSNDGTRLYVHNFLGRSVGIYDISALVNSGTLVAPAFGTVDPVAGEALTSQVLLGKRLFYDARANSLSQADYMSCASCHNDGDHDGRVWDLTGFGEGLRNTIELNGRAGMGHGALHWSGNFDEVQDFENQIRDLSEGTGLITNGSPHAPLGAPNAGRSANLDALAAYVASLDQFERSASRTSAGALTAAAVAGKAVFVANNCASCHSGENFTDSAVGNFHDVGTIKASSGQRLGSNLTGLDTPTLRGLWAGAPYLHDGSATTLEAAVNAHSGVNLNAADLADLVAYLKQIDGSEPGAVGNLAPLLAAIGNQNGEEDVATSLALSAGDPDGDSLTFTATGLPAGLTLSGSNINGTPQTAGTYSVTVTVADGNGGSDSETFSWVIVPSTAGGLAYGGTPWPIPGRIQAENYDTGGPGVSYLDFEPENLGGAYRTDQVDIENSFDSDGTPSVGWAFNGEWMHYSATATAGTYRVVARAASPLGNPGNLRILIDGVQVGVIDVSNTGDWYAWQNFESTPFAISSGGAATVRLEFSGDDFNLNWIEFVEEGSDINLPPVLAAISNQTSTAGTADSLALSAADPNGDPLTYTVTGLPAGLSQSGATISGTPQNSGMSTVSVTVSDGRGGSDSQNFNWTVAPAGGGGFAYGGLPPTLPARIQAEHYDTGGAGVSYFDRNAENIGGAFRTDGVDLEDSQDTDATPSLGWAENGEWLQYTVQLTAGSYNIIARAASELENPGALQVQLDGSLLTTIDIASTNDWYTWQNFVSQPVTISGSGMATFRLQIVGDDYNLNWIELVPAGTGATQTQIAGWGSDSSTTSDAMQDLDGDGRASLVEYAYGGADDDGVLGVNGLTIEGDGDGAIAGVLVLPQSIADVEYHLQISGDRVNWQDAGVADGITTREDGMQAHRWSGLQDRGSTRIGVELGYARVRVVHTLSGAEATGAEQAWYTVELRDGLNTFGVSVAKRAVAGGLIQSVNATGIALGTIDFETLLAADEFYLEVQEGSLAGHRFEIDEANSAAGSLVLDTAHALSTVDSTVSLSVGDRVLIRPHHRLNDALVARHLDGSIDPGLADGVQIYQDGSFESYFVLDFQGITQWTETSDATLANSGGEVLAPGQGMFINCSNPTAILVSGEVRTTWFARPLVQGYNFVSAGHPVATSPAERMMGVADGGFLGSLDPAQSDRFHLWAPDSDSDADGYRTHFLLDAGAGTGLQYWTSISNSSLLPVDDEKLFEPGRAVFIELPVEAFPEYRYPSP